MITHIVLFALKEEAEGRSKAENIRIAQELVARFLPEIPQLKACTLHVNMQGAPQGNDDLALVCAFESLADLDAYQVHPTHQQFVRFISGVRSSRRAIDYTD